MTARVVWCLGVYASASTWLFNVAQQMAKVEATELVETHFISQTYEFSRFDANGSLHIVKSHEITDHESFQRLGALADKIIISLRDPRDAVTSLMLYHRYDFDRALSHVHAVWSQAATFVSDSRSVTLNYESGFFDQVETLAKINKHLDLNVSEPDRERIFLNLRRTEVEKHVSRLNLMPGVLKDFASGDLLDPKTHWHTHHAGRSGEIGRWRKMLTLEQIDIIFARFVTLVCFQ